MNKRLLFKQRAAEQLSNQNQRGQVLNPVKRYAKKKPYKNRDYQAIYEYIKINYEGPPTILK